VKDATEGSNLLTITFAKATFADVPALTAVQTRTFDDDTRQHGRGEQGGPPGYNSDDWQIRLIQQGDYYKIVAADKIVGGFIVYPLGGCHWELGRVYIDPAQQNRGIGAQVLAFIEREYPQARRWTLDTPTWARRNQHFYEKHGYVKIGEMSIEDGATTLVLYEKRMVLPEA